MSGLRRVLERWRTHRDGAAGSEHRYRWATAALAVMLCAAASAGCAPSDAPDPLAVIVGHLNDIVERESPGSVTEVALGADYGHVVFVKGADWQWWTVNGSGAETQHRWTRESPTRPGGLSVAEVADQARRLREGCSTDYFRFSAAVVSKSATLTKISCTGSHIASLNGQALPVLTGGWTRVNLETVWRELRVVAGGDVIRSVSLDYGEMNAALRSDQGRTGHCEVAWRRPMGNLGEVGTRCEDSTVAGPIDLGRFPPARVAQAISSVGRQFGASDTSEITATLLNTSVFFGVRVCFQDRSEDVSAKDW